MPKKDDDALVAPAATLAVQAPEIIRVKAGPKLKSKPDGGTPVALWERDSAHPGGEVFIAGDKPIEAARTSAVSKALADGRLIEV